MWCVGRLKKTEGVRVIDYFNRHVADSGLIGLIGLIGFIGFRLQVDEPSLYPHIS